MLDGSESEPDEQPRDTGLDLSGAINSSFPLPNLFPDRTALLGCGVKRVFCQSAPELSHEGIVLGHVHGSSARREVRHNDYDRQKHTYILGGTGTGKSTLLYQMIRQDIENGEGVVLIDPHGDLYTQVLHSIPERRKEEVVLLDPSDYAFPVGINFLELSGEYRPVQMNFITNEMIRIFDKLYDLRQTGGPMFEQYMRNALLLVMDNDFPGATLMDIQTLFEDNKYRKFLLTRCRSAIVESFWTKQAERAGGEAALENMTPYITSKLNQFTTNAVLRPIISQSKSTINFREAMDTGKIVLVNLSKGMLGELDSQLLGMLVIGKLFSAAMGRVNQRPEQRRQMFLYIDEFQNFVTDSMAFLLSEARKFGLHLTLANQNLAQMASHSGRQNILDSILGNVGSIVLFRVGAIDAEKMAVYTKPELEAKDLQELPAFCAVARLLTGNSPSRPFLMKTLPPLFAENEELASEIIRRSREKNTWPVELVEKTIFNRRLRYEELDSGSMIHGSLTAC